MVVKNINIKNQNGSFFNSNRHNLKKTQTYGNSTKKRKKKQGKETNEPETTVTTRNTDGKRKIHIVIFCRSKH